MSTPKLLLWISRINKVTNSSCKL